MPFFLTFRQLWIYATGVKPSDRTQWLLERILRIRRLQSRLRGDPDLAAIRIDLEEELGATVSRRAASRFLDVSRPALERWIERGDLPLIPTLKGRDQVPVGALLDLYERIEEQRSLGQRQGHHLETVLQQDRDRAERMRTYRYIGKEESSAIGNGHSGAELRSLAYHRAIAGRLTRKRVEEARHRTFKWMQEGRLDRAYGEAWLAVLSQPISEIRNAITSDSQEARDLRQNSPFAGLLSERERKRLLEASR